MTDPSIHHRALVLLGLLAVVLTGCPNPNVYGTPRTTPEGEFSHTIAAEALSISGETTATSYRSNASGGLEEVKVKESVSVTTPVPPTYQLRYGVSEQSDLGFSVKNLTSLGVDYKYNPVKGQTFDLAVDPGVQFFRVSTETAGGGSASVNVFYLHLPLLLGFNLGKSLSLVLTPGGVVVAATGSSSTSSGRDSAATGGGILGRLGVGLNIRISKSFALQPEVTAMRRLSGDDSVTLYMAGLGFNFGKLPTF